MAAGGFGGWVGRVRVETAVTVFRNTIWMAERGDSNHGRLNGICKLQILHC